MTRYVRKSLIIVWGVKFCDADREAAVVNCVY